jgi:hypothetical protein
VVGATELLAGGESLRRRGIAIWAGLLPSPSRGDDFRERGVAGLPAKLAAHFFAAGDQDRGVAGTPGKNFFRDFAAGDLAHGVDDFVDRVTGAGADVESAAGYAPDVLQGAKMGFRNIQHMHVIADAGAVRRGIVVAKNFDVGCSVLDCLQDARNQVGFGTATFSALAGGAGNIEIAKRNVIEAGVFAVVGEDVFKDEFGFAVGIYGRLGMVFGDGHDVGLAIDGAGGGEDQAGDAVAEHSVEKDDAAGYVGYVEGAGILHGFFDEGLAGEMHDGVDAMALEDFVECGRIAEVGSVEDGLRRDGAAVTFAEVIESDDMNAGGDEEFRADAADIARGTGDQDVQVGASLTILPCREPRRHMGKGNGVGLANVWNGSAVILLAERHHQIVQA